MKVKYYQREVEIDCETLTIVKDLYAECIGYNEAFGRVLDADTKHLPSLRDSMIVNEYAHFLGAINALIHYVESKTN